MEQIEKFIRKLNRDQALIIMQILGDIVSLKIKNYDVEKMKGFKDLYRIRSGKIRIIFLKENGLGKPVYIEYRGRVYKKF
jgi:mRNA-degrading endonuclease RelE of RelBE toxin-antitoxin system